MSFITKLIRERGWQVGVADLGAGMYWSNEVDASYRALFDQGLCKLYLFEPLEEHAEKLRRRFGDRAKVVASAVGDGSRINFFECNYPSASGCLLPNVQLVNEWQWFDEPLRVVKVSQLDTVTLDSVFVDDRIDFLKMDIQGAELMTIRSAPLTLSRMYVLQTESDFAEIYVNQPRFGELDAELRKQGFEFYTFSALGCYAYAPFRLSGPMQHRFHEQAFWPKQVTFSLSVYVRNNFACYDGGPEGIIKGAAVLHEVYKSYDMAYRLLKQHDRLYGGELSREYLASVLEEQRGELQGVTITNKL